MKPTTKAMRAIPKSHIATALNGDAGPTSSNMYPATTEKIVWPKRPKKLLKPIITPLMSLGKLRKYSTSTLMNCTADATIISIDKTTDIVDSGSYMNWN